MPYIELTYDKIINEIEEYIINQKIKLKRKTLKQYKNKSNKFKKKLI